MRNQTDPYHTQSPDAVCQAWEVDSSKGLSQRQVRARQEQYGSNQIQTAGSRSTIRIWIAQFRSVVVLLLAAAAILAFVFDKHTEGGAILAVILVNALIGFCSEWRAARSMEALRAMDKPTVRVRREGNEQSIPATDLVPGDICVHESGDMLAADLRVLEANGLQVDESSLTGESVSVSKSEESVAEDRPLAERRCILYRGTTITKGSATGCVVATGMDTELGHIAAMAQSAGEDETTPLEQRLNRLGQRLAWVALGAAALIGAAGFLTGRPMLLMIETAIALGVAAIPEGLPFVATIGLARGMALMARKQALVNRLPAVETLGTTNIIMTDKTGTLTENRMDATVIITPSGQFNLREDQPPTETTRQPEQNDEFLRCLEIGVLCNNAAIHHSDEEDGTEEVQGDPTEVALLRAATRWNLNRSALLKKKPEVKEEAFTPDTMMMATVHETDDGYEYAVKGAPAAVLAHCGSVAHDKDAQAQTMTDDQRDSWAHQADELAAKGLRVLALAYKREDRSDADPYENLRLVGLVGMFDPPRDDAQRAIEAFQRAGIRVVMVSTMPPRWKKPISGLRWANVEPTQHVKAQISC